jgi:hypothetical protein
LAPEIGKSEWPNLHTGVLVLVLFCYFCELLLPKSLFEIVEEYWQELEETPPKL